MKHDTGPLFHVAPSFTSDRIVAAPPTTYGANARMKDCRQGVGLRSKPGPVQGVVDPWPTEMMEHRKCGQKFFPLSEKPALSRGKVQNGANGIRFSVAICENFFASGSIFLLPQRLFWPTSGCGLPPKVGVS